MKRTKSNTKSQIAFDLIREMILNGTALPGSRLILMDLEEKLGVGRGPIRDALLLLHQAGLVQNIPFKGAIVKLPPTYKEMQIIYEQRKQVEIALALEALKIATQEQIDELEKKVQEMEKNSEDEDYFFHIDRKFHRQLYELSNMPHLVDVVEHFMDYVQTYLTVRTYSEEHIKTIHQQHKQIIKALNTKDENLLKKTLEDNIMIGLHFVQEEMQKYPKTMQRL